MRLLHGLACLEDGSRETALAVAYDCHFFTLPEGNLRSAVTSFSARGLDPQTPMRGTLCICERFESASRLLARG